MTVIQTINGLVDDTNAGAMASVGRSTVSLYGRYADYAELYRTQPNVRTCVDFLARNIAQIGLHVYRRVSDTDRERLTDHPIAELLGSPNPFTTTYRLMRSLVSDLDIYGAAYWVKIRARPRMMLFPVPAAYMSVSGRFMPEKFTVSLSATRRLELKPADVVHFHAYNPLDPTFPLSPLETLRRILAEEWAAADYREWHWRNAGRMSGIIERPVAAPEWGEKARERFAAEFEALYSGSQNSGKTAILEDGMTWKAASFSAQDSQYIEARKLTREECARAYHIPLPMVGILDHATFSNITEQHKNLYQDCLAPTLEEIQQELELQLVPEFESRGVYLEFNIAEKMRGSFEEQAASFSTLVGRPVMSLNEGRARLNLPRIDDPEADGVVVPLNVMIGGQASPRDVVLPPKQSGPAVSSPAAGASGSGADVLPTPGPEALKAAPIDAEYPRLRARHVAKWKSELAKYFKRQAADALSAFPKSRKQLLTLEEFFSLERWNRELADDLFRLNMFTAGEFSKRVADAVGFEFDPDELADYYRKTSKIAAEGINGVTLQALRAAMMRDEPRNEVAHVFDVAESSRAPQLATTKVTQAANQGAYRAAGRGGLRTKTWQVNSGNPRSQHADVSGETVQLKQRFSNGMLWPGDPTSSVGAEEIANCQCSVTFS